MRRSLVYGAGFNDSDYNVSPRVDGVIAICPIFQTWRDMIGRCYNKKVQASNPTYLECSVVYEWLFFSNFKNWMENQDWIGKQLDKDLLFVGNKVYSPETCVFVSLMTNNFVTDSGAARGNWPIGVNLDKNSNRFRARCCNPFSKQREHLGYFDCPNEAHQAWKKRKHELACKLAETQTDERVANALRRRYL